ncbi:hypothetical protein GGR07_001618 [Bacteroides pyogenes]|nr:hypothetical protein [Bacteroides pyogenes]SUV70581.1 Uncharacterised protein [Bacteroides pyogenes]
MPEIYLYVKVALFVYEKNVFVHFHKYVLLSLLLLSSEFINQSA